MERSDIMDTLLEFMWNFLWLFLLVLIATLVFYNKSRKNYSKLKKRDPIRVFIAKYNLDVRKVSYKKILLASSIINSFIISFAATLVIFVDNYLWAILICFVVVMCLIYALYDIAGRIFKKMEEKENV